MEYKKEKEKTAPVYTDSSRHVFHPYLFPLLAAHYLHLHSYPQGNFYPFNRTHQLVLPPIYPSHNELLYLHYILILLHQPGSEAPARLETRGRGGEVGGKGCRLSSEETEKEKGGNGRAGESAQLPRAA